MFFYKIHLIALFFLWAELLNVKRRILKNDAVSRIFCYSQKVKKRRTSVQRSETATKKMVKHLISVLTKPRNDVKPPETRWNHLRLPETTQKLPETTGNQPFYSIFYLEFHYMLITIMFIFSKFLSVICFWANFFSKSEVL